MIAFALTAVLIIQTYGGDVKVTEGLSDHACVEALCVAKDGMTCAEREDNERVRAKYQAEAFARWAAEHPNKVASCSLSEMVEGNTFSIMGCGTDQTHSIGGPTIINSVSVSDVKVARCVK